VEPSRALITTLEILPAAMFLGGLWLRRACRLQTRSDEEHFAPTHDGWNIALYRYRPAPPGGLRAGAAAGDGAPGDGAREPVVLCHGMLSNRFAVDLDDEHSLARFLARSGFDAWVMELRGHGRSVRAATGGIRPFDWTIDDYVRGDLPAVVDYVRRATGAGAVHWVGHSLGGMILYAAAALGLTRDIRSAVMLDVPVNFWEDRRAGPFARLYVRLVPVVPPVLFIPFVLVLGLVSPSLLLPKYGIRDRRTMLRIVANGIIDLGCGRVARQLVDLVLKRRFVSADGRIDYEAGVDRIHFPVLQLAAARRISPDIVVRALIDRAPVADKAYLRLSRSSGFSVDYNHFTLLLGENAPREVFPLVAGFLDGRRRPAAGVPPASGAAGISDRLPSISR
jgi:pimeloyl-ACP methyl ester carboxylesterase